MPITDLLERNSKLYGEEIALVEINPEIQEEPRVTWREYELIQPTEATPYRREITWAVFDEKDNFEKKLTKYSVYFTAICTNYVFLQNKH